MPPGIHTHFTLKKELILPISWLKRLSSVKALTHEEFSIGWCCFDTGKAEMNPKGMRTKINSSNLHILFLHMQVMFNEVSHGFGHVAVSGIRGLLLLVL